MAMHTVVQHSGYGYSRKPEFERGLESRSVTKTQAKKIEKIGGVLFETYQAAEAWAEKAMYTDDNEGLTPNAPGEFATMVVDGLRVYVPAGVEQS